MASGTAPPGLDLPPEVRIRKPIGNVNAYELEFSAAEGQIAYAFLQIRIEALVPDGHEVLAS